MSFLTEILVAHLIVLLFHAIKIKKSEKLSKQEIIIVKNYN